MVPIGVGGGRLFSWRAWVNVCPCRCLQVWDMRSKNQIHVLGGHTNTVGALLTQAIDPQVITGGMDSQVKVRAPSLSSGPVLSAPWVAHHPCKNWTAVLRSARN